MTPSEAFERMRHRWLTGTSTFDSDLVADDIVLEMPFAAPGHPTRIEGRRQVVAFTDAGRAGFPVRFTDCRHVLVHRTADPDVIVVEYQLAGIVTTTGHRASAPFVGVLTVHDGRIAGWREYQDKLAIAAALQHA